MNKQNNCNKRIYLISFLIPRLIMFRGVQRGLYVYCAQLLDTDTELDGVNML